MSSSHDGVARVVPDAMNINSSHEKRKGRKDGRGV